MSDARIDTLKRHCPRLGGEIPFNYCMMSGEDDGICWKILDCWWELFDVESYLKSNMPATAFEQLMKTADKPKNKIASILGIIEKAKNAKGDNTP